MYVVRIFVCVCARVRACVSTQLDIIVLKNLNHPQFCICIVPNKGLM
jgi:hypothetical protein